MNIRNFEESDVPALIEIHKQYSSEFGIEEFKEDFKCFFVVEENGQVITLGGVRMIPEVVIMTNRESSIFSRVKAIRVLFSAIKFMSHRAGLNNLHCFIQDYAWLRILLRNGFRKTRGVSLITDI